MSAPDDRRVRRPAMIPTNDWKRAIQTKETSLVEIDRYIRNFTDQFRFRPIFRFTKGSMIVGAITKYNVSFRQQVAV